MEKKDKRPINYKMLQKMQSNPYWPIRNCFRHKKQKSPTLEQDSMNFFLLNL
jgi:hypothetical protein